MKGLTVILIACALMAVSLLPADQTISTSSNPTTPFAESAGTVYTDPFYVHESTNPSNYTSYLSKGTYFIEIASEDPFSEYFNATLLSHGVTLISLYTENFEFHGITVNNSGVFTFTTIGSGKWLFSESAQDPYTVYSSIFNNSDAYVMVPQIGTYNAVNISFTSPSRFYYEVYDSLLRPITSYVSSEPLSSVILNLSGKYVGIIFISVNGTSSLQISWTPYTAPSNNSNASFSTSYWLVVIIISIIAVIALISSLLIIKKGVGNSKVGKR